MLGLSCNHKLPILIEIHILNTVNLVIINFVHKMYIYVGMYFLLKTLNIEKSIFAQKLLFS